MGKHVKGVAAALAALATWVGFIWFVARDVHPAEWAGEVRFVVGFVAIVLTLGSYGVTVQGEK